MFSQKSLLKEITNNSINGIIITDKSGTIKAYNRWCIDNLGWKNQVDVGKNINILSPVSFRHPRGCKSLRFPAFFNKNKETRAEFTLKNLEGKELPVQFAMREIEDEGSTFIICYLLDMTEHYQIERERKKAEDELNALTRNIPGIVFQCRYERNRPIQFIDPAIEQLAGIPPKDFLSGKVQYAQLMQPEDEMRIWHAAGLSLQRKDSYNVEYRLIHTSGKTTWVSENGKVVCDERGVPEMIVGVITDNTITKTVNAEFESTVNAMNKAAAVVEFDLNGTVTYANDDFLNLLGYSSLDEIQGHHHRLFCSPQFYNSPEYEEFWDSLRRGEFAVGEYHRIGKGGKDCWIQASYNPILDADGKPYKVKKFATDLSERKKMENDLRIAIQKAEDAVAARGYFMANMSHEIRTPMNSIIGFTEVLLDTPLDDSQRHHLQVVRNASRSLLRLLNEILDMSKLEKGAVELEITDFNFMDLCEQIIASMKVSAEQKGIDLILDIKGKVPEFLKGDSLRIQQILLNLLSNAIKFTEKGSVTLQLKYNRKQLSAKIIDTGIGIEKAYLQRIFDPFTQAEASTTRRFGGTGLGTAISNQLVTLMKGSIDVESELNVGTTFTVLLPVPVGEKIKERKVSDYNLPPMYILAVDDTPNNLDLLKITMTRAGHTIDLAGDGQEAIDACKKERYDLILMDMQMPKVDGLEATRQIRAYEKEQNLSPTPTIAFSASVLEQDRQDALEAGMHGFATKPLDLPALFEEISSVFDMLSKERKEDEIPQKIENAPKKEEKQNKAENNYETIHPGGINWKAGLRLWGEEEVLVNSIDKLLQDNATIIPDMEVALKTKEFDKLAASAHKLAGAAGNLSLFRVHKIAKQIEMEAPKKDNNVLQSIIPTLDKALQEVALEIKEKSTQTAEEVAPKMLSKEETKQVLLELEIIASAIKKNEMPEASLKKLSELLPRKVISPIRDSLSNFDFDNAQQYVSNLQNQYNQGKLDR